MATLQKPTKENTRKSKAKAKTKVQQEDDEIAVGGAPKQNTPQERMSAVDFEQFQTIAAATATTDIVSHECSVAAKSTEPEVTTKEPDKLTDKDNTETAMVPASDTPENVSLHEELAQANESAPTAPPADNTTIVKPTALAISTQTITKYPDLMPMQRVETKSEVVYQRQKIQSPSFCLANSHLKPFTEEQLKEIYSCAELELVKHFELEFLMNSLLESQESDPLYAALLAYYNLQSKLTLNLTDIEKCRKQLQEAQDTIWKEVPITKTFSNRCGDNIEVHASETYNIIQVNGKGLAQTTSTINRLGDIVFNTYITNLITSKVTKVKIDQIINEILLYPQNLDLAKNASISLRSTLDAEALKCVANLRRATSIVFSFMRKISPNENFKADLKLWLRKLISLQLLLATREDHWFILFNILRCPSGVASWATSFVQVPVANQTQQPSTSSGSHSSELPLALNSPEMNHCIATIQILLLPIKKRNEYLKEFTQFHKEISDPIKEERWTLIDSDGEDSHTATGECVGLKEADLIALLNQMPFEHLFTSALNIEKFLDDYVIDGDLIAANQVLKVIAFFAKLIEIFGEGMLTYNTERYKQFAKRLGRLVRHTLQYIADYHEIFIHNNIGKDVATCERIAVELNVLLIKACSYIYRTSNLATWQYFSSLPFNSLNVETIWQIFYYLNVGFPTELPVPQQDYNELINAPDFWQKFNIANSDHSAEDLYYLLQAFFEMANERDKVKDWEMIKIICLHIFKIGFINKSTRDICYKTSRDMLVNLTLAYEDLMSFLLLQFKAHFNETENATYLFQSLPLENWKPAMDSFEILSNWLLNFDFQSQENVSARIIISHLNWGFDCDGRLFLPHNIHVRMACLITEALTKHAPETIGLSGISESVRQVSNLLDFTQSTKEHFTTWCWSMVSILRLHVMDQSVESIKRTLQNPTEPLMFVPELERIDIIYQGVSENRPLALYVGILVSLQGHSIPLICQKGFDLMKLLLNDHRHAAVIRCIELIVPLFLDTPETLANCESFHVLLNTLLNADKTYLKMAKDIMYPNSIGPVLELLDDMIHHQITTYTDYGLFSPLNLINIWLNCLTALPNWQNTSVVYLLDRILRIAYQFPDSRLQAVEYFCNYYKDCEDWKSLNKMSALKTLFGSGQTRIPTLSALHGWLALVLLELEFRMQEASFWPEFIRQLAASTGKINMDNIVKKTANIVKISNFPAHMLVIYKYGNLIATMDINHPVFPILTQKFFELYLSRVPLHYDDHSFQNTYGVSDKFYESNVTLMKKIKTNLQAAKTFYNNEATKRADNESHSCFYRNCAKITQAYLFWLEETSISKKAVEQFNFPPNFNVEKLIELLNGNTPHWTEYIYLPEIRKEQRFLGNRWASKCFRSKSTKRLRTPLPPKSKCSPVERMKKHLCSYDKRLAAPQYTKPHINAYNEVNDATLKLLKSQLKSLCKIANKFNFTTCDLNSLNRNYLDNIVHLYKMVPYDERRIKKCNALLFNRVCKNPAIIKVTLEKICKDSAIERKIDDYRERHEKIIDSMLQLNVEDFAIYTEEMSAIIKILIASQMTPAKRNKLVTSTGINFFYSIIEHMTDVSMKFKPTNDLFSQMLNELGLFIQENQEQQGLTILELSLKRPDLIKELAGVFVPCNTAVEHFLKMYKFLIDSYLKRCDVKILFVLLSKFDLVKWLEIYRPKLYDINQLLQLVLRGLECWSQSDSSLLQNQFQRHLVHIFNYDFPQHYGEVMQMVLERISEQKLMPVVLLDLLNSLLERFDCTPVNLQTSSADIEEIATDFARRQNLFNLKAATDTVFLFARHFQKERLNHGLHGLYPKHKDYCQPLSIWFSIFNHVVVITAICTYHELLADQISETIFGSVIDMYSPWLIAYTTETMQQSSANWIRQLKDNDKIMHPWSEQHAVTSKIMITPFINNLIFVLDNLPISHKILAHTFGWYVHHFALPNIPKYVYEPIHESIALLPWERFIPQANYIDMLYDSLQKYIPESHAMLGHIFIRINWNAWFADSLNTLPEPVQIHVVSRLFSIFIKIAFEPNIHIHINTSKILEDAINYPWHLVEYAEMENLLKWFLSTVEPSIILNLPTESNYADRAVLDLLRLASAMMPERSAYWKCTLHANSNASAKRILYARCFVRLLRSCAAKNQKLLATKDGLKAFNNAFTALLNTMNAAIDAIGVTKNLQERRREALNLMIEIIVPMQTQSEEASNLHISTLIEWQQNTCATGNLLMCSILSALGHMTAFIAGIYSLLEASIAYYFRSTDETKDWHTPTWQSLLQLLQMSLDKLELMPIIGGSYFFTAHIFILYRLEKMQNIGDQITFLQDTSQLTESMKTHPSTEPRLFIVWGLIIARGCKILTTSEHVKKPLLMVAHHLEAISTQAEGWSDGLLGVIGLKRDVITNSRKALSRCLACVIFSLFPCIRDNRRMPNQEFTNSLNELAMLLANKKFVNIKPLIVNAVNIIEQQTVPDLRDVPHLVCRLFALFYSANFLMTIPEVWDFDFKLN